MKINLIREFILICIIWAGFGACCAFEWWFAVAAIGMIAILGSYAWIELLYNIEREANVTIKYDSKTK